MSESSTQTAIQAPVSRTIRIARGSMLLGFLASLTISFAVTLGNWWLLILLPVEFLIVELTMKTFSSIFQKPMEKHQVS